MSQEQTHITLYNYFRSSTSYRVRIALEFKKLVYIYKPIHLLNNGGEQNSEAYRKLNPIGGVPTLIHKIAAEERIIAQSSAIIDYLDDVFTQHPLYPNNPYHKAVIKQICQNINADIHPYGNLKTTQYLTEVLHLPEEAKNTWVKHWVHQGLKACEKLISLHAGEFCYGNSVTAADMFLIPQLFTAQRFQVDLKEFKTLWRINQSCLQISAFDKAHPYKQIDTPADLKLG